MLFYTTRFLSLKKHSPAKGGAVSEPITHIMRDAQVTL